MRSSCPSLPLSAKAGVVPRIEPDPVSRKDVPMNTHGMSRRQLAPLGLAAMASVTSLPVIGFAPLARGQEASDGDSLFPDERPFAASFSPPSYFFNFLTHSECL